MGQPPGVDRATEGPTKTMHAPLAVSGAAFEGNTRRNA
ncbi:hypothetical protein BCO37747_05933 [Burkholderia contaminans]|nr:hypothetical protein BCO37747_05933 [Burkholderia contaminans]